MSDILSTGNASAKWRLVLEDKPAGELELHATNRGWAWRWHDKPAHLVRLLGVPAVNEPTKDAPWVFADRNDAVDHLMHATGKAFYGHCGLVEVVTPASPACATV